MFRGLKKTVGVALIGLGLGILLVLLLPMAGWLFAIRNNDNCSRFSLAFLLEGVWIWMKVVVKKVPKFLRGFVKLIFGIKD